MSWKRKRRLCPARINLSSHIAELFEELLLSSFFGAEERISSCIFDLRSRRSKNLFSLQSSIFGAKIEQILHLRSSLSMNESKIGRKKEGESSFFVKRRILPSSTSRHEERRTPFVYFFDQELTKNPLVLLLPTACFRAPAPFSYSEVWIFRSMFHLEDRSEDRNRPSTRSFTLKIGPKIEIGPLLVRETLVSWANCSVGIPPWGPRRSSTQSSKPKFEDRGVLRSSDPKNERCSSPAGGTSVILS